MPDIKTSAFLGLSCGLIVGASSAWADSVPISRMASNAPMTTTVVFKLRHKQQLADYIQQTVTPGPHYHDFLAPAAFRARYAPSAAQLARVSRALAAQGIRVQSVAGNRLAMTVSGPARAFEQAFGITIRNYQSFGDNTSAEYSRTFFHRPNQTPTMSRAMRDSGVLTVVGLSNQYRARPLHTHTTDKALQRPLDRSALADKAAGGNAVATGVPGQYTVADVANLYNVNPLYTRGINGRSTTLGIATYADFLPSDATTYWNTIGLTYKPDRISRVRVDGGGEFGADAGTGETSLDVEQAGGLAPFADIVVYDAPNSTQGGLDMFNRIVSDNRVDSLSYSWGLPEIFYFPGLNGGVDARGELAALDQIFMQAAAQGISIFAASGDAGAYDTNRQLPYPDYSKVLSVDWPGASAYITAAGGTTVPYGFEATCGNGTTSISVNRERAWSYDYLAGFFQRCRGLTPSQSGFFAGGGGGGVSVYTARPSYQRGIRGMRNSQPNQALIGYTGEDRGLFARLPANYAGRNVPDISMNADSLSGYYIYSTPDGGLISGYGGTSFVAPQLNGITALINQDAGRRVGFMNPQLYRLLRRYGYRAGSPFRDINRGSNWFWQGVNGYDPATGIGTPNAVRLSRLLSTGAAAP